MRRPNNSGPFGNFILDNAQPHLERRPSPRCAGQHTLKAGYYYFLSYQRRGQGDITGNISFANDTNNPLDTTFGFSNAALGVFSTYSQLSRWGEGAYLAVNHEAFVQDNWRVDSRFTLDYGVRFVHQVPQYDDYGFSVELPAGEVERGPGAAALRRPGARRTCIPARRRNRRAMNPVTGRCWAQLGRWPSARSCPNTGSSHQRRVRGRRGHRRDQLHVSQRLVSRRAWARRGM